MQKFKVGKETVKTIVMIVAILLALCFMAGLIAQSVALSRLKSESVEQQAVVVDDKGNMMVSGTTYAMPARMVFATTAAEVSNASEGITLTATISPETADNKAVDWSVAFVNPSSSWANGKKVTDYVTVLPSSDGALTATVNCLKAFGEQIIITVTSRANPKAKAECTLDYARRILDTALYQAELGKNILEFGSDEILLEMAVPDFAGFNKGRSDGTIWAGEHYLTYLAPGVQITPADESDPEAAWGDESASLTYRFSDYTIKDCLAFFTGDNEYGLKVDELTEVNQEIKTLFCSFATEANKDNGSPAFSFQEVAMTGFKIGNNPIMMALEMLMSDNGVGISNFDQALYEKYMGLFIDWVQENPNTPIAEYTVTYTGKYSTFTRHFTFRFNPETLEMPVFGVNLDKTEVVI